MSTNRIDASFAALADKNETAFIPYIVAGDPDLPTTAKIVLELERVGADLIELGVPFSAPVADGIANQEGALRALKNGVSLHDVVQLVRDIRKESSIPILLFSYYNPVLAYGIDAFSADCADAGVDGVLCVDLPPEEAEEYCQIMKDRGLSTVFLIAPTSTEERIRMIAKCSTGFIYYVSRTGVTGERDAIEHDVQTMVQRIKGDSPKPVAVGFGISKPEHVAEVADYADGVVVGSAIVRLIGAQGNSPKVVEEVGAFVQSLVEATKTGHVKASS